MTVYDILKILLMWEALSGNPSISPYNINRVVNDIELRSNWIPPGDDVAFYGLVTQVFNENNIRPGLR